MRFVACILTIVALAVLGGGYGAGQANGENIKANCPGTVKGIEFYRVATWKWQHKLGIALTKPDSYRFKSCAYAVWVVHRWQHRALHYRNMYHNRPVRYLTSAGRPPHYSAWICIHNGEGSWTDSGAPYWGGLQMDLSFQSTYAAEYATAFHTANPYLTLGTADKWPPITQMWVAEEAYKTRGFSPWPNTARVCGLIP